jgi:hypothetical protein
MFIKSLRFLELHTAKLIAPSLLPFWGPWIYISSVHESSPKGRERTGSSGVFPFLFICSTINKHHDDCSCLLRLCVHLIGFVRNSPLSLFVRPPMSLIINQRMKRSLTQFQLNCLREHNESGFRIIISVCIVWFRLEHVCGK